MPRFLWEKLSPEAGSKTEPPAEPAETEVPSSTPLPSTPGKPTGLTRRCGLSGQDVALAQGQELRASWNYGGSDVEVATAEISTIQVYTRRPWLGCRRLKQKVLPDLASGCEHVGVFRGWGEAGNRKGIQRLTSPAFSPSVSPGPGGRAEPGTTVGH